MTCSDDGTVRLWSLIRRTEHVSCIKTKTESGKKTSTTTCTYNTYHTHVAQNEYLITAGCDDGSIQIWDRRRPFVNVTFMSRHAHEPENSITSLRWSYDGRHLASRSTDHTLKLWDIRKFKQPLSEFNNLHNRFSMTDVTFSPDDRFLITGTSTRKKTDDNTNDATNVGSIYFFNRNNLAEPEGQIQVSENASVIKTLWHSKLNQIMCTTSNGIIKIFYDPIRSKQGALLFANREERQKKANDFFINMNIINPHALPLYRQDRVRNLSVIRMKNREDPVSKLLFFPFYQIIKINISFRSNQNDQIYLSVVLVLVVELVFMVVHYHHILLRI
jgi:WD40 repeat protein